MDNETFVSTIRDPQAKKVLYEILKRLDRLESTQTQPAINLLSKSSDMLRELGFKSKRQHNVTFPDETA